MPPEDANGPERDAVRLRAMAAADLEPVKAIARELKEAPDWPEQTWQELAGGAAGLRVALVAERGCGAECELVGFSVAQVVMETAELELVAVKTAAQRRGVGERLLAATLEACRRAGAERMLLEVRASNVAAQRLYERAGFGVNGRRAGYYHEPVEDAVCMERRLG